MKVAVFLLLGALAHAADTNIIRKDGTTAVAKSLRRQGDNILATVELPVRPGDPVVTGEVGIPISQIQKIDFPEPAILKAVPEYVVAGKGEDTLPKIDEALKFYEGFRDAPGSWWADIALLKMNTLFSVGRAPQAFGLADTMTRLATEPETKNAAKILLAAEATSKGNAQAAADTLAVVMRDSTKPDVLASAAIYKGQSHLALKDWENALLCFLQIPVLYPDKKAHYPAYMLGVGRAHFGLEDFPTAKATLNEVIKTYAATLEATAAKAELELIAKREKALADPK